MNGEQTAIDSQRTWLLALRDHINTNLRYGGAVEILAHGRLRVMLYLDEHKLNYLERHFLLDQHAVWGTEFLRSMFGELHFMLFTSSLARHTGHLSTTSEASEGTLLNMSNSLWGSDENTMIGNSEVELSGPVTLMSEANDEDIAQTLEPEEQQDEEYDFLRKTRREAMPQGLAMMKPDQEEYEEMDDTQSISPPVETIQIQYDTQQEQPTRRAKALDHLRKRVRGQRREQQW